MESRAFIKAAADLITKIEAAGDDQRDAVQKDVNVLFGGLTNPTLPSAYRLRDAAVAAGYTVKPEVLHRLAQFENLVG